MDWDWARVVYELENYKGMRHCCPLTLDTLHGSMWALDPHPSKTFAASLSTVMRENQDGMLAYSIHRIRQLITEANIQFNPRETPRCTQMGLGTFGWKYDPTVIRLAVELGVGLIDTAEGYGYGRVETALGLALDGMAFDNVTTKVRKDHMSPNALPKALERSIRKLGRIPHVQLHYPNPRHPNALRQLASLRMRGKARSVGVGNCSVDMVEAWQRQLTEVAGDVLYSVQVPFSLIDQRANEVLIPYCQQRGILVLAYSPLGQKFTHVDQPVLRQIAKKHAASPAQVALAWILGHHGVMPIPRTNNTNHLQQNMESVTLVLPSEDMETLSKKYTTTHAGEL